MVLHNYYPYRAKIHAGLGRKLPVTCGLAMAFAVFSGFLRHLQLGQEGHVNQCLSQDLETGCLKLAVVRFLGVQIFK